MSPDVVGGAPVPVVRVDKLRVEYPGEHTVVAVRDVSMELRRGEILGIAGESGSGKSTLAYGITRLLTPPGVVTGGSVAYHDRQGQVCDVLAASPRELRRIRWREIAIVFQAAMNALNPVLTVFAQIDDVLRAHRPGMTAATREERARELCGLVGIPADRLRAYPHELSGGMRQRAVLAIALALDPEVIVLDEPTTALDVVIQRQILSKIVELRDALGFSVVFITHDMSLLVEIADRIAVMYAGRIIEQSRADALYRRPLHPYSVGLLRSFPTLHGERRTLAGIAGLPPDLRAVPSGCAFHPRCGAAMDACRHTVPEFAPVALAGGGDEHSVACLLYDGASGESLPDLSSVKTDDAQTAPSASSAATPDPTTTLRAEHLSMRFRLGRGARRRGTIGSRARYLEAVHDVSLSLSRGQVTALVGESGSGKTTVGRLLARVYKPSQGTVELDPSTTKRRSYAQQVQLVFQDPYSSLNPTHTVGYHLARAVRIHQGRRPKSEVKREIERLLEEVRLVPGSAFVDKYPHELSGGQRQRVSIARSLAAHPDVLVADEPVSMLDVSIRLGVLNLIAAQAETKGLSILYITHDIASARYFADEVLVMYAGELVESGPAESVTQHPAHPYTQLLVSCAPDPDRLDEFRDLGSGEMPSLSDPPAGCRFHPRCPHAMDVCRTQAPQRTPLGGGSRWVRCWLYEAADGDSPRALAALKEDS